MKVAAAILSAALVLACGSATPPQPQAGIGRTDLLRSDLSISGREVVQVRVDIPPGVTAARHSHPGEEIAYVLKGTLEYRLDGRPPVTLKAGETLFIPHGAVHSATNVGTDEASELATYIVEKGNPLVVSAK